MCYFQAPICTYIGSGLSSCNLTQYYDTKVHRWKPLKRFSPLPHSAAYQSTIVIKGRLYTAGGLDQSRELDPDELYHDSDSDWDDASDDDIHFRLPVGKNHFYQYHAMQNKWSQLPAMNIARNSFPMVYLDNFIYAIGGSNESGIEITDVERYDLRQKEWKMLPPLPERCRTLSAVAFKGKIIVHGVTSAANNPITLQPQVKYVLQVYHPNSKYWQRAHSEVHGMSDESRHVSPPHLFLHKDTCYRVSYTRVPSTIQTPWVYAPITKPCVQVLDLEVLRDNDGLDSVTTVKIGESISQEHIPENSVGAFRIGNEVFVSQNGFSYCTGITITSDQVEDVDVDQWNSFIDAGGLGDGGMTCFTFDRKKLEH